MKDADISYQKLKSEHEEDIQILNRDREIWQNNYSRLNKEVEEWHNFAIEVCRELDLAFPEDSRKKKLQRLLTLFGKEKYLKEIISSSYSQELIN